MGRATLACCLSVAIVVLCSDVAWSLKAAGSKKITKPRKPVTPKSITAPRSPGDLLYGQTQLALNFRSTEEAKYYAGYYTRFPDDIFYPWNPQANTTILTMDKFAANCFNVTVTKNSQTFSKDVNETHIMVLKHLIKHLCLEEYGRVRNTAISHSGTTLWLSIIVWIIFRGL